MIYDNVKDMMINKLGVIKENQIYLGERYISKVNSLFSDGKSYTIDLAKLKQFLFENREVY